MMKLKSFTNTKQKQNEFFHINKKKLHAKSAVIRISHLQTHSTFRQEIVTFIGYHKNQFFASVTGSSLILFMIISLSESL